MLNPIQVTFRDFEPTDAITDYVHKRAAKLDHVHDRLTSCRVVIETPHRHHKQGDRYHVRVDLTLPGHALVVGNRPSAGGPREDVYAGIDDGVDHAVHALKEHLRKHSPRRHEHEGATTRGKIVKLFGYEGYGFLESAEGVEVYFHRNAVLHDRFDQLALGQEVRFVEELGEKGPQASTVEAHKH
ncbi:MAG: HPF/RaiA family ribosome-associated protein [Myxococcales bacterium]|nr:HPF/RaiA family ribosome-associated protein [Myxococcales bacterium]